MNIAGFPVMKSCCQSCPFAEGGDIELRNAVMARTGLMRSQICHHPRTHGKRETHLCRGSRDHQLTLLHRLGWITAPTDTEWFNLSYEDGLRAMKVLAENASDFAEAIGG